CSSDLLRPLTARGPKSFASGDLQILRQLPFLPALNLSNRSVTSYPQLQKHSSRLEVIVANVLPQGRRTSCQLVLRESSSLQRRRVTFFLQEAATMRAPRHIHRWVWQVVSGMPGFGLRQRRRGRRSRDDIARNRISLRLEECDG